MSLRCAPPPAPEANLLRRRPSSSCRTSTPNVAGDFDARRISFATALTAAANFSSSGRARRIFARSCATYEGTILMPAIPRTLKSRRIASLGPDGASLTSYERAVPSVDCVDDFRRCLHELRIRGPLCDDLVDGAVLIVLHLSLEIANI